MKENSDMYKAQLFFSELTGNVYINDKFSKFEVENFELIMFMFLNFHKNNFKIELFDRIFEVNLTVTTKKPNI